MYFPGDILKFGKNKGLKLSYVYRYQPGYIVWAIENVESFKINVGAFSKLPPPRLIKSVSSELLAELFGVEGSYVSMNEIMINAEDIEKSIDNKSMIYSDDFFEFPNSIININNSK